VFFGHPGDAHVAPDNDHGIIGTESNKSEHGRFEVLFVSTEVKEIDYFGRSSYNLGPVLVFVLYKPLRENLPIAFIKPHYLLSNARGSAVLHFMLVIEDPHSGLAPPVIGNALGQHANKGGLPRVHVADDGHLDALIRIVLAFGF